MPARFLGASSFRNVRPWFILISLWRGATIVVNVLAHFRRRAPVSVLSLRTCDVHVAPPHPRHTCVPTSNCRPLRAPLDVSKIQQRCRPWRGRCVATCGRQRTPQSDGGGLARGRAAEAVAGCSHTEACERPHQLSSCGRDARYHPERAPVRSACVGCGVLSCAAHAATRPRASCFQLCWRPAV